MTEQKRRPALTEQMVKDAIVAEFGDATRYVRPTWQSGRYTPGVPARGSITDQLVALTGVAKAGIDLAVLVPGRTDTRWMHQYCAPWEVRFLRGRVRFEGHKGPAPFPSAVVLMGPIAEPGTVRFWDVPRAAAKVAA